MHVLSRRKVEGRVPRGGGGLSHVHTCTHNKSGMATRRADVQGQEVRADVQGREARADGQGLYQTD
jgi:hypothetical protein